MDEKYGILVAVEALRYAMLREGLETDGLVIVLPDRAYDHTISGMVGRYGDQMVYAQTPPEMGARLMGVRLLPASLVDIAG